MILLMTFIGGLLGHQTKPIVDKAVTSPGWNPITAYTLGVTLTYPFVERLTLSLVTEYAPEVNGARLKPILRAGYFGAFLFFGMGTAAGWFIDVLLGRDRE